MARTSRWLLFSVLSALTATLLTSTAGPSAPVVGRSLASLPWHPEPVFDGDLVFRTGNDVLARLVLTHGQQARFSHVGLIVRLANKNFVVHSTPAEHGAVGGVHAEPLEAFASSEVAREVAYFRVDELDALRRVQIREYLLSQIGKPFDYRFKYSDDEAHYCTELALRAFEHAAVNLERLMDRVHILTLTEAAIPPDSLSKSPRLRELTRLTKHVASN